MNIRFYSLALTVVAMLSSCSNDEGMAAGGGTSHSPGDVAVSLAAAGLTRASIESGADGLFEADSIGVFALASGVLPGVSADGGLAWATDGGWGGSTVLLDNVAANARRSPDATHTDMAFADGPYFYPNDGVYSYSFYAYHPRTSNVEATDSTRVAVIRLTGKEDLIYGKAVGSDPEAFSAIYFRRPGNEGNVPSVHFEHKLMRLTFTAQPVADADGQFDAVCDMAIDSVKVIGVPAEARLTVADMADGNEDGKVSFDWADKAAMEDFLLLDTGDRPLEHGDYFMQVADGKPVEMAVGQGIMLPVPPAGAGQHRYQVAVTLRDRQGNVYHGAPQEVGLPGGRAFEAGKSYNVKLVVGMGLDTLSAARQARSGAGIMDIVEARGQ